MKEYRAKEYRTKEYRLEQVNGPEDFCKRLKSLPEAKIGNFVWNDAPNPKANARMGYDDKAFYVYMEAVEPYIRAMQTEQNGPVYTDSCLELYLMPAASSSMYFNIEINPIGTMFFSVGEQRDGRILITDVTGADLGIRTCTEPLAQGGYRWSVSYALTYELIQTYIPQFEMSSRMRMKGNFYKCGNGLPVPHWGTWAPVNTPKPDFHRPEWFGTFVLE